MATDPTLDVTPASPTPDDLVTITASGTVPEGSTVVLTSDGDELQKSPPFGIGDIPLGTGDSEHTLKILGGTSGTFELNVYEYGDDPVATTPIYYYNDSPTYAYPDMDDVSDAIEAALPGADVTVTRVGPLMTILIGGEFSGRHVLLTQGTTSIGGSEAVTIAEIVKTGGSFALGPLQLEEGDYEADLLDGDGDSLLDDPVEFSVEA